MVVWFCVVKFVRAALSGRAMTKYKMVDSRILRLMKPASSHDALTIIPCRIHFCVDTHTLLDLIDFLVLRVPVSSLFHRMKISFEADWAYRPIETFNELEAPKRDC